jgi:hypothetical protein
VETHIVRICELIVSAGLKQAQTRWRAGSSDTVEEFRTRVNAILILAGTTACPLVLLALTDGVGPFEPTTSDLAPTKGIAGSAKAKGS